MALIPAVTFQISKAFNPNNTQENTSKQTRFNDDGDRDIVELLARLAQLAFVNNIKTFTQLKRTR